MILQNELAKHVNRDGTSCIELQPAHIPGER